MHHVRFVSVVLAMCALVAAPQAFGQLRAGTSLPVFSASDLHGRTRLSAELAREHTLVVVCTSGLARNRADQWLRTARARFAREHVRIVTLAALNVPFFVTQGYVLDRAKAEVPLALWGDTWVDVRGLAQHMLALRDNSATPYVFTVDRQGHVLASVHAQVTHESAAQIWSSIGGESVASTAAPVAPVQ